MNYKKMNPKYKDPWLKALRSGRRKQTEGNLENSYGNCCLGVLCRVGRIKPSRAGNVTFFDGEDAYLSEGLREKFGIDFLAQRRLTTMNDGSLAHPKKNFRQIADWIEKYL